MYLLPAQTYIQCPFTDRRIPWTDSSHSLFQTSGFFFLLVALGKTRRNCSRSPRMLINGQTDECSLLLWESGHWLQLSSHLGMTLRTCTLNLRASQKYPLSHQHWLRVNEKELLLTIFPFLLQSWGFSRYKVLVDCGLARGNWSFYIDIKGIH